MTTELILLRLLFFSCSALSMFGCAAAARKVEVAELRAAYAIHQPNLTCEQANQFSYRTVERLGYTIRSFTPAASGMAGLLKGGRASDLGDEPVTVQITCAADGVHVDANAESPLDVASEKALPLSSTHTVSQGGISGAAPARVYFRRGFYASFMGMVEVAARGEAATPQGQLQVTMKPLVGLETTLEFGQAVTGVLAVRVECVNTTSRAYVLEMDGIVLTTSDGKRVKALPVSGGAFPVAPLATHRLAPSASIKGYLYYPPGSYSSARGSWVEEASQEREGFTVQFSP